VTDIDYASIAPAMFRAKTIAALWDIVCHSQGLPLDAAGDAELILLGV